jgi:RND family efflux transporter MFP subunit
MIIRNGFVRGAVKFAITVVLLAIPTTIVVVLASRDEKPKETMPPTPANVEVITVRRGDFADMTRLPVVAETPEGGMVKLGSEAEGRVVWVGKRDGEAIREGEAILKVDKETLDALLAEARASFDEAKIKYERVKKLFASNHISQDQLDTARAAYERLGAMVKVAEVAVSKATLRSPIDGIVDRRYVEVGEYLQRGALVADIVNTERLYAVVEIPERDRQFVAAGMPVHRLEFDRIRTANPGGPFTPKGAVVQSVSQIGDERTRTYRTQIAFDNSEGLVKPGMIGTVLIQRPVVQNQVIIPIDFIVSSENDRMVYVASDGEVEARPIQLGLTDGRRCVILSGVSEGERIIRGPGRLRPGEPIRVVSVDGQPVQDAKAPSAEAGPSQTESDDRLGDL